jgi:putative transposase
LNKQCAVLAAEFPFANNLNSMARQSAAERAWAAISRFYDNCKKKVSGLKGFPSFQKDNRSVEYKTSGWKLADDRKSIVITDKIGIGKLKLKGTRDLNFYQPDQIKRVRLVKRADGYYAQFCISADRKEVILPTKSTIGLDMGLNHFYTDSNGEQKVFGRATVAVNPAYTSQKCSSCGVIVKKSLSTRTHVCQCGCADVS